MQTVTRQKWTRGRWLEKYNHHFKGHFPNYERLPLVISSNDFLMALERAFFIFTLSTSRSLSVHLIQCSWKESVGNRLHLKNFTVMSPSKTKALALRTAQTPGCRELSLPNTFCPRQKNCETVQRPQYTSDKQKTKQTNMDFLQYALELGIYLQLYCSTSVFWSWAQSFSLSPKLNVFACRRLLSSVPHCHSLYS